jgi:Zn-finger nucleic acid-binding protein
MNCPNCGAPLHLEDGRESAACEYCKAVYVPPPNREGVRVFDQPSELLCPICQAPLRHATLARQRILYCTGCDGSLIPMPVFVVLVHALRAQRGEAVDIAPPPEPHQLDRAALCPQCGRRMDTHFYGGGGNVVIDDCSRCELNWLDAGELMAIAHAPDHSLDYRPPPEYQQ